MKRFLILILFVPLCLAQEPAAKPPALPPLSQAEEQALNTAVAEAGSSPLEFMRAIPPPATVPIAGLLIGYNEPMKLIVVVLAALWPILMNIAAAIRQIDPLLLDVARSFRRSR